MKPLTMGERMRIAKKAAENLARLTGHLVGRPIVTRRDGFPTSFFYPLTDQLGRRVGGK